MDSIYFCLIVLMADLEWLVKLPLLSYTKEPNFLQKYLPGIRFLWNFRYFLCKVRNYHPQAEHKSVENRLSCEFISYSHSLHLYSRTNSRYNTYVIIVKGKYLILKCMIFHTFVSYFHLDTSFQAAPSS